MRKPTALIAAFAILASLTACTGGSGVNGCAPALGSGAASSVVKATGKFGSAPSVNFPTPLYSTTSQSTELKAGKGEPLQDGQPALLEATILNGTSGKVIQKTSYGVSGGSLITTGKSTIPAVTEALRCATVGSRLAIVGSPKDSHNGIADATSGIAKNDSFVYVVDVKASYLARANGADQIPQSGLPSVVLASDGTPGISLPDASAPKSFTKEVLKQGSGAKLATNDFAVVQYTGVSWSNHAMFDSTWTAHQATGLQIGAPSTAPGLTKGLTGERVGSQVLLVLPAQLAAPSDGSGKAPAGETVIYVVDILGIAK